LTPEQVLVQGLKVGSTDLILWSEDEQKTWQRRVTVRMDANTIRSGVQGLFPGAALDVSESGEILLVRGSLRSADQAQQLVEYLEKTKTPYVNMTTLSGVQQVQLQVRVAEVSRGREGPGVNAFYAGFMSFSRPAWAPPPAGRSCPRSISAPPAARMSPAGCPSSRRTAGLAPALS
jgi:pilus assembly protein CpaC